MEWWVAFALIVGALCLLMAIGMPIAFAFLAVNIAGAFIFWGGTAGINQMVLAVMDSVASFSIMPVPLFLLMGELLFRSGIAARLMDVLDAWLGRVPGRLSLMAVGGGTLFATLAGSGAATTALLGRILVPDMMKRGYKQPMTLGPVMGSGGLAVMIPPSALGVILAATADISVGEFLMSIIVPGLMMALSYAIYVVLRCYLQPDLAPAYVAEKVPLKQRLRDTVVYVFPLATIVFVVTGLIFLGIATPTESAGLGALAALILARLYGRLNWSMLWECLQSTMRTSIMVLMILSGSSAFSQLLAFTGASAGLVDLATSTSLSPVMIVISMQVVLLLLGTFMESLAMILLTVPIYFPIIEALHLSPIWFGAIMLLNMEMAAISPPFGFGLFVMKAVAPKGTTMMDVYKASVPFLLLNSIVMLIMIFFPSVVLWLPSLAVKSP
jgi:tripartite ATP-independent transporter DctM subunit